MSKIWVRFLILFGVLGITFFFCLTGFRPGDGDKVGAEGEQTRIICFLSGASGMNQINTEITRGLEEQSGQSDRAALSVYNYDDFEDRTFTGGVETFLAMQGNVMIAFGTNEAGQAAELVEDNQVKLILLDTDTPDHPEERIAFIGTDNRGAVREIIQSVKENVPEANAAVFITHQHSTTFLRRDALQDLTDQDQAIQIENIYYISSDSIEAFTQMREILSENPEINTVLCLDGFSSQTAASVIPAMDQDYYTVGFDISDYTVKALENGDFDLLVSQDYDQMGKMAVEIATNYQEGEEAVEIYRPCDFYTQENAEELAEEYFHGEA